MASSVWPGGLALHEDGTLDMEREESDDRRELPIGEDGRER
jgi:hypothetical protein